MLLSAFTVIVPEPPKATWFPKGIIAGLWGIPLKSCLRLDATDYFIVHLSTSPRSLIAKTTFKW
jgi:hypothetical protein